MPFKPIVIGIESSRIKMSERVLLPTTVYPTRYNLTLNPDLEKFVFSGDERIELKLLEEPSKITKIVANSKELEIKEAFLTVKDQQISFKSISFDEPNDYVIFELDNTQEPFASLKVNDLISLHVKFTGELNDKLVGFYRTKYTLNGVEKYAATTQFEPTDARRACVCFDEPALKSVFEVSLIAPKTHKALSNMHCVEEKDYDENKKICKFAPTPVMSTYLLCFIVGEFDFVESIATETHNKIPIRVYTPIGKKEQGLFSLQVACKVLALFEKYFDCPYPLTKLDLIGIPDFGAGAMESKFILNHVTNTTTRLWFGMYLLTYTNDLQLSDHVS